MIVRNILQRTAPFSPFTTASEALACFAAEPNLFAAPVVDDDGRVLGLVQRLPLKMKLADRGGAEMFAHAPVTAVMDPSPLIVEGEIAIEALCSALIGARSHAFQDGFVITEGGRYLGLGSGLDVLDAVAAANAESKERLKLAMSASRSAIWEVDFQRERLIGAEGLERIYKRRLTFEDIRRLSADFVVPEEREAVRTALLDIASGSGQGKLRAGIRRDDGTYREMSHAVHVHRDGDNHIARMVFLTSDNTIMRRIAEEFAEAIDKVEAQLADRRAMIDKITQRLDLPQTPSRIQEQRVDLGATYEDVHKSRRRLLDIFDDVALRDQALMAAVEAVEAASAAKSRFLANMSHELRTPLNAILGYAEILDEDLTAAQMGEQACDAQRIRSAARHLLQVINEILDLSKIEAGRMDVSKTNFDVAALAGEVVETLRPLADKNDNALTHSFSEDLGFADTDTVKLKQCLLNLLSNACKFTKAGAVSVAGRRSTREGRDCLVFEISDTGIGMSDEQVGRLFQPFIQADAATTRNFGGTGLGLAITQRLARLMGGDVEVRSALGVGTTFTLIIPARFAEETPTPLPAALTSPAVSADAQDEADESRPLVIIIDDDADTRDLVRRSLARLGFRFLEAATGASGLDAARTHRSALIILDIQLPDMLGWSVLETLQKDQDKAPVLIMSVEDDKARALSAGACDLLIKPTDRDVLAAAAVRYARLPRKTAGPVALKLQHVA